MPEAEIVVEFRGSDFHGWTAITNKGRMFFLKDASGKWLEIKSPLEAVNLVKVRDNNNSFGVVRAEPPDKKEQRLKRETERKLWGVSETKVQLETDIYVKE